MIPASTFKEKENLKIEMRRDMYKKILSKFCKKIETYNSFGKKDVILQVPAFYLGMTSYNVYNVSVYMQRQLTRLGYRASILNSEGNIHVAWGGTTTTTKSKKSSSGGGVVTTDDELPSLANLKKAADSLRKKFETT
jgi:hypothetical protein